MMQEKIKEGDVYIQYLPYSTRAWPEYVKITKVFGDGTIYFIIYTVMFDDLTTCVGEGSLNQLSEGLDAGDIKKVGEEELQSFICIHKLLEG